MRRDHPCSVAGKTAVLATMHGKERVMRPLIERGLNLFVRLPIAFDTDRFVTFSGDVRRAGSRLDAACAKTAAAFVHDRDASVGIASDGSFGPHPSMPVAPLGCEIVVLLDRETGLELVGRHVGLSTNYGHVKVVDEEAAVAFATRIGFPSHGVIVAGTRDGRPAPDRLLQKNIDTLAKPSNAVSKATALCGAAHIETDMRANRNPMRMRAIKRATIDLLRQYRGKCPTCGCPGFAVTERLSGLPCSWCGAPTHALRAEVMVCAGCGHRGEKPVVSVTADPGQCDHCNP